MCLSTALESICHSIDIEWDVGNSDVVTKLLKWELGYIFLIDALKCFIKMDNELDDVTLFVVYAFLITW